MFSRLLTAENLLIALAWVGYGILHSVLASGALKPRIARRWPAGLATYRLAYNALAVVLLVPLLIITEQADEQWLWRWDGYLRWFAHGVTLVVLAGFAWTSRAYDMREFLGLTARSAEDRRLGLSPLHRCVRHPWYFLGLVWLWTRDMDAARLSAASIITLYIWIGSLLEDRKLEQEFGAAYRDYRKRVPGLLPRPWRCISREEFARLRTGA